MMPGVDEPCAYRVRAIAVCVVISLLRIKALEPTEGPSIMLTVYGEGRGFRVVWLLEELGLAYRLRPVDLLAVENDRDFLAVNPAGFIPALQDGETIMVESIAILEYLLARHGPASLARAPDDFGFG